MFLSLLSSLFIGFGFAETKEAMIVPRILPTTLPGIEVMRIETPSILPSPLRVAPLSASGVLLVDVQSGEELFARSAGVARPMASLTKIMTALLTLESSSSLDSLVTTPQIVTQVGGSTIGLVPGEKMTTSSLLLALLLPSANDSAFTLASKDGSITAFVKRMNRRAKELGLHSTHFQNPAGLDDSQQYSTPRDLARLTLTALRNPYFRAIVETKTSSIQSNQGKVYSLRNTNELLHFNEHVFGVKTGTTNAAGECLIVLFEESDRQYLIVLLGSKERYTDALTLLSSVHQAHVR
jgi:D-alanyl-D-alanine carboxypeptidase